MVTRHHIVSGVALGLLLVAGGAGAGSLLVAQKALEDGLYDLGERQADEVRHQEGATAQERGDAGILLARAYFGQHRFKEMLAILEGDGEGLPTSEPGARAYWHAVALYESGRAREALGELSSFAARFPGSPLLPRASRLAAWCNLKEDRRLEAFSVFEEFDRQFGATEEGAANLLDWGQALLSAGNAASAEVVLDRLVKREGALSAVQDGKLWLAKAMVANGRWEAAWNVLNVIAADPASRSDRRAIAWITISEIDAAHSNLEAAVKSAAKGVEVAPTAYLKDKGRAYQGRWLLRSGRTAEGASLLRPVIARTAGEPLAGDLQLELAHAYAVERNHAKAAEEYQYYLETFSDPAGCFTACRGKALALWHLQRYAEAAVMFDKAAGMTADAVVREELLIKTADAHFANGQYKSASAAYARVLQEYPGSALAPQVLFQDAESLCRQLLWEAARDRFREVVRRYPGAALAERAMIRVAETFEEQGPAHIREALAAYADFMNVYPSGALYAEALHRHGLAAYQAGDIDLALRDFNRVVSDYPRSALAPQAYFMRGWAYYMRGQEEESLKVCRSFIERYPDSEWTPGVMFWLGEYAYNHGKYADAEAQFTMLADQAPKDALADQALIWAGRSAMLQKEYLRAIDLFSRVAKSYPASTRLAEARFLQGDALCEVGEFSRAILVFDDLLAKYPSSPLVSAAWGRKGDCQFTLGAADARRYEEAIASYRSVARSPGSTYDLGLQAEYMVGRCLDKQGKRAEALEQYYTRVVVAYLASGNKDPSAAVWFTKAAFSAADILELEKAWKKAIAVLERVVEARVPASAEARKRVEQLRAEHWIW